VGTRYISVLAISNFNSFLSFNPSDVKEGSEKIDW